MRILVFLDRSLVAAVFSLFGCLAMQCNAQERAAGQPEHVRSSLWPKGTISEGMESEGDPAVPTMDVHLPDPAKATGSAVVVLPGGGYGGVSMNFEGVHSAQFLTDNGIAAFVVRYRHAPRFPYALPLEDARRAVRLVRSRAVEFHVDPNRIGLMGFSVDGQDKGVPPENSILFAEACRKAGVSVELHLLSQGEHGYRDVPVCAEAYECLQRWLARNGWLR